jgi:hypothetical protein
LKIITYSIGYCLLLQGVIFYSHFFYCLKKNISLVVF